MHNDDTPTASERYSTDGEHETRESFFARVRTTARDIGERVRKALCGDDDTRPPGFNGAMLLA